MHVCYLLHDIYVLSEEGTGCNRSVRRWGKMYYQRKRPGVTGGCENGAKIYYQRKGPDITAGAKTGQNILLEEGIGLNQR